MYISRTERKLTQWFLYKHISVNFCLVTYLLFLFKVPRDPSGYALPEVDCLNPGLRTAWIHVSGLPGSMSQDCLNPCLRTAWIHVSGLPESMSQDSLNPCLGNSENVFYRQFSKALFLLLKKMSIIGIPSRNAPELETCLFCNKPLLWKELFIFWWNVLITFKSLEYSILLTECKSRQVGNFQFWNMNFAFSVHYSRFKGLLNFFVILRKSKITI